MSKWNASTACLACRTQHLKCDWDHTQASDESPRVCVRCASTGKVCSVASSYRFRHSKELPAADQRWIRYPRRLQFVDETRDIGAQYFLESGLSTHSDYEERSQSPDEPIDAEPSDVVESIHTLRNILPALTVNRQNPALRNVASRSYDPIPQQSLLRLANADSVPFPLMQSHEVRLMKYYLEYMCTWFDLCDSRSHFANIVPYRAATCPTLLNAIFALSSRHLSLSDQYDPYAADWYHQECLKYLTTISDGSSDLENDDLLAATILLRTLEELDVPLRGADHESHLLGIQLFMNTPNSTTFPSSLRQASFWIGLRQEVTLGAATQRPVKIKLDHAFIDRSFAPADDDTWANRIVVHCAEVMNYCFGTGHRTAEEYQSLVDYDAAWLRARPVSWLPIAYSEPSEALDEVFPYILFLNHAVVIGHVHGIYARMLLMCHDDRGPRVGPSAGISRKRINDDIERQLRELCGIALTNAATRPAMFTACMGVVACGDRFTDRKDQDALLSVLVLTETMHSWPTGTAQLHLKRAWGWQES